MAKSVKVERGQENYDNRKRGSASVSRKGNVGTNLSSYRAPQVDKSRSRGKKIESSVNIGEMNSKNFTNSNG